MSYRRDKAIFGIVYTRRGTYLGEFNRGLKSFKSGSLLMERGNEETLNFAVIRGRLKSNYLVTGTSTVKRIKDKTVLNGVI